MNLLKDESRLLLATTEITVEMALDLYLQQISVHKAPETHEREKRKARQIAARLGSLLLVELTPFDLSEYRDFRLKEASAAIVQGDLALLENLFEVAVERWALELVGNPVKGVEPPRPPPGRLRAIEPGERVRLLAACDRRSTPMLGWIVRIALQTAMAKDEILRLRESDLDLDGRMVTVAKYRQRGMRQVPLSQACVRVLQDALNYSERPADETLLFFGATGKLGVRSPLTIDKSLRIVFLQARLKGFCYNDLRNTASASMEAAGLTEVEIRTIVGLPLPRMAKRPPRPTVEALVARLDDVGFGLVA